MEPGWSLDFVDSNVNIDISSKVDIGGDSNRVVENSEFIQVCKIAWDSLLDKPEPVIDDSKANSEDTPPNESSNSKIV